MTSSLLHLCSDWPGLEALLRDTNITEIQLTPEGVVWTRRADAERVEAPVTLPPEGVTRILDAVQAFAVVADPHPGPVVAIEQGALRWIRLSEPAHKGSSCLFVLRVHQARLSAQELVRRGHVRRRDLGAMQKMIRNGQGLVVAAPEGCDLGDLLLALLESVPRERHTLVLEGPSLNLEGLACTALRRTTRLAGPQREICFDLARRADVLVLNDLQTGDVAWVDPQRRSAQQAQLLSLRAETSQDALRALLQVMNSSLSLPEDANLHALAWCKNTEDGVRLQSLFALPSMELTSNAGYVPLKTWGTSTASKAPDKPEKQAIENEAPLVEVKVLPSLSDQDALSGSSDDASTGDEAPRERPTMAGVDVPADLMLTSDLPVEEALSVQDPALMTLPADMQIDALEELDDPKTQDSAPLEPAPAQRLQRRLGRPPEPKPWERKPTPPKTSKIEEEPEPPSSSSSAELRPLGARGRLVSSRLGGRHLNRNASESPTKGAAARSRRLSRVSAAIDRQASFKPLEPEPTGKSGLRSIGRDEGVEVQMGGAASGDLDDKFATIQHQADDLGLAPDEATVQKSAEELHQGLEDALDNTNTSPLRPVARNTIRQASKLRPFHPKDDT